MQIRESEKESVERERTNTKTRYAISAASINVVERQRYLFACDHDDSGLEKKSGYENHMIYNRRRVNLQNQTIG